jgi:hypothetical protein
MIGPAIVAKVLPGAFLEQPEALRVKLIAI